MTIALASRGYLQRIRDIFIDGSPTIAMLEEVEPAVGMAGIAPGPPPPVLQAAAVPQPIVQGATSVPPAVVPGPPNPGGANLLIPIIRKAEES